jgi:AraC-like DNA-binding protein
MKDMENIAWLNGGMSSHNSQRAEPVEIWKARNFIHEQADDRLSLKKVAQAVKISPNYLSEKFKRVTGENFVGYISRRRVEKARDLLRDSHLRISEIAFAVGFQSLSQFNRTFKKLTGQSPSEMRATLRANGSGPKNGAERFLA